MLLYFFGILDRLHHTIDLINSTKTKACFKPFLSQIVIFAELTKNFKPMIVKIILIIVGSIVFPAAGYYLDYRDKKKRRNKKQNTLNS